MHAYEYAHSAWSEHEQLQCHVIRINYRQNLHRRYFPGRYPPSSYLDTGPVVLAGADAPGISGEQGWIVLLLRPVS